MDRCRSVEALCSYIYLSISEIQDTCIRYMSIKQHHHLRLGTTTKRNNTSVIRVPAHAADTDTVGRCCADAPPPPKQKLAT